MTIQTNTLVTALDAIEDVFEAGLQAALDIQNTEHSWNLVKPKSYNRGASAVIGLPATPALLTWVPQDAHHPLGLLTGDHVFTVVFALALAQADVKSDGTASVNDLTNAVMAYGHAMMLALRTDITSSGSLLRAQGVYNLALGSSQYDPPESSTLSTSYLAQARYTCQFHQRRQQTR
jgi:hypothetical protein